MDSLFQDSTTPPVEEEPDRNPTNNHQLQGADLSQGYRAIAIAHQSADHSLEEQTELERALIEANARRDFFNASDPFHDHLRSPSKDFLMDHPIVAGALEQENSGLTPSVGVQASPSSLIGPRPSRDPHQGAILPVPSADSGRADGAAAVGGAVDVPAPAGMYARRYSLLTQIICQLTLKASLYSSGCSGHID
jgi:hypothetical protein